MGRSMKNFEKFMTSLSALRSWRFDHSRVRPASQGGSFAGR
jgi:hypothetical protein